VREINVVRPTLPADVFSVEIRQFTPGTVNIVQLALVSETAGWREFAKHAENLEELIETAPGVRRAETWAYPDPEVRVAIDLERLASAGVTLGQVIAAVQGENEHTGGRDGPAPLQPQDFGQPCRSRRSATPWSQRGRERAGGCATFAEVGWSAAEERYTGRFNGKRAVFVTASMRTTSTSSTREATLRARA
jgi:multidrug efflux pump subunit AcrB